MTPAPSEKRKVARGALLCSQGGGSKSGPSVNPDRASIAKVGWTGRETELPEIAMMRRNLTPNPFPHGKGDNRGRGERRSILVEPLDRDLRADQNIWREVRCGQS